MTVAQKWIEFHRESAIDHWIGARIDPDYPAPVPRIELHPLIGGTVDIQLPPKLLADKVVFEEDLGEILTEMINQKQIEIDFLLQTVRLPTKALWIEFSYFGWPMALLLERFPDSDRVMVGLVTAFRNRDERENFPTTFKSADSATGLLLAHLSKLPLTKKENISIAWQHPAIDQTMRKYSGKEVYGEQLKPEDFTQQIGFYVTTGLFGLLLLTQPKLIEERVVEFGEKLNKKRRSRGLPELLGYRRIYVKVGKPRKYTPAGEGVATSAGAGAPTGKKKYHHVIGSFRMYRRDTPEAYVKWVDEYWRGDPKLGVIIHERKMSVDKDGMVKQVAAMVGTDQSKAGN